MIEKDTRIYEYTD